MREANNSIRGGLCRNPKKEGVFLDQIKKRKGQNLGRRFL